jgi:hypothetical protein
MKWSRNRARNQIPANNAWPTIAELQENLPRLIDASSTLLTSFGEPFTGRPGGHLETDITAAASLAGSLVFRASVTIPPGAAPGTPVIGQEGHEGAQILLGYLTNAAGQELGSEGWTRNMPPGHEPCLGPTESVSRLQAPFEEVALACGLEPRFYPFIAATAALRLILAGRDAGILDPEVGKPLALFFLRAACRTVPPALSAGSILGDFRVPSPQRPAEDHFASGYDFWQGHLDRLDPGPAPLDEEIGAFCRRIRRAGERRRGEMIALLTGRDSYQLQHFADRAAIFGLRSRDLEILRQGLTAACAVNAPLMDYRDLGSPLGRLYYCLFRAGFIPQADFAKAALDFPGPMQQVIARVVSQCSGYTKDADFEKQMVYPVETADGWGFISSWHEPYAPTVDLVRYALTLVPLLRAEKRYQFQSLHRAAMLPYPLRGGRNFSEAVPGVLGVCTLDAQLRPESDADRVGLGTMGMNSLTLVLLETDSEEVAARLASTANEAGDDSLALIAWSQRYFLGAVLCHCAVRGAALAESRESLARFESPLSSALERLSDE